MEWPRVLGSEDEVKVRRALVQGLTDAGFEVETAATGNEGSQRAGQQSLDCIVLDWMLPGRDGLHILRELRQSGCPTPVLLLTARDAIEDRVLGLESGADDYLIKPFAFAELLARIRALLRRGSPRRNTMLRGIDLELHLLTRGAIRNGEEIV